ncbi:MAG: EamA family transporter [Syntrophobacterales bacterium]|nr:MAG: EamA family transporter [Syntrophobacterales bacterium]
MCNKCCYMLLLGRIGAEYAAYVTLLMPVIALILSTIFEDYRWTISTGLGVIIVLAGNLVILTPTETLIRAYRRMKRNSTPNNIG